MAAVERSLRADARRNREAVLDAAAELFAQDGENVQMDQIAARAGLGVGTLYRHFVDKQALRAAIIGRRFEAVTKLAREAEKHGDAWAAFETLLYGYLESVEPDAAFRFSILSAEEPTWADIESEKKAFAEIMERICRRAVEAGHLRADFTAADFVLISRGAMANVSEHGGWRRFLELQLEGIRVA